MCPPESLPLLTCAHTQTHTHTQARYCTHRRPSSILLPFHCLQVTHSHTQANPAIPCIIHTVSVPHTHTHPTLSPPQACPTLSIPPAVCSTQSPLAYRLTFISWHHKPLHSTGLTYGAPCTQVDLHTLLPGSNHCRTAFMSPLGHDCWRVQT